MSDRARNRARPGVAPTAASEDDEMVTEFLRTRAVTKCPAGFAAATTAAPTLEDAAQHAARGIDPTGDAWRKKAPHGWARYWASKKAGKLRS